MTRASLALAAALALAASGCDSKKGAAPRTNLRQPSAIAVFRGYTLLDPANLHPYLAVANASRNDLTLVEATSDTVVDAPVEMRPLAVPFLDRPALLASADLGDGQADLLVGVSAGSSVLQLVRTWAADNGIDGTVDLLDDVVALVALPSPVGTARLVAALADDKLAVVEFTRAAEGRIVPAPGTPLVHGLGFGAMALATVPGDEAHVYAATLDPIGPAGVQGAAEIDVSAPAEPWPVRALDARAPTRLVAAARLQERKRDATEDGEAAFAGQPVVTRVYAVLDEGSCGPLRRIDCGLVALDPAKAPGPGDDHVPDDDWSVAAGGGTNWMPYRAPVRFAATRPLAIAVAQPPGAPPPDAIYPAGYMRLQLTAERPTATTAVAVVAAEDGQVHFVDLGRFRVASTTSVAIAAKALPVLPAFLKNANGETRLWIRDPATGGFAENAELGAAAVGLTPGYAPDASWTVRYQGILPGLELRSAEAGREGTDLWLAIQIGEGPLGARVTTQVARLYHPALGVAAGDIAVIKVQDAKGSPICTLPPPAGSTSAPTEFELSIAGLLPPTADRPGGAVVLARPPDGSAELACYEALLATTSPTTLSPPILATIRAGGRAESQSAAQIARGLVVVRAGAEYAGRLTPTLAGNPPAIVPNSYDYVLEYPAGLDDDAPLRSCPLALVGWDGSFPPDPPLPACDATCRADCEELVLARKARRVHHLAEGCGTDQACADRLAGKTLPFVNGPALKLRVGVEVKVGTAGLPLPVREHSLSINTSSGAAPVVDRPDGATVQANGAIAFDRSPYRPEEGYRFFVSYPGNQVVDVSPSVAPVARTVIR